jgi:hypothetical protein
LRWWNGLAAATLAVICATRAWAGWDKTAWDMTPDQVAQAAGQETHLARGGPRRDLAGFKIGNEGRHEWQGLKFRTTFYYDDRGLALVDLEARPEKCVELARALVRAYGQPVKLTDQVIMRSIVWHDAAQQNRILLIAAGAAFCDLRYYRLADWERIDLAHPLAPSERPR